jgi:hypothetical protein
MEIETLGLLLDQKFGIKANEWLPDLSIGEIVDLVATKRKAVADGTA